MQSSDRDAKRDALCARIDSLWAEYEAQRDPMSAEYQAKRDALAAEYESQLAPIRAAYTAKRDALLNEYEAKLDQVRDQLFAMGAEYKPGCTAERLIVILDPKS
jgi:hypothetical protein